MTVIPYGPYVRVVHYPSPFGREFDVEVQTLEGDKWVLIEGFHSLSNDWAYTAAAARAVALQLDLRGKLN